MLRIPFYRFNKVGDQVVSSLELVFHLGPFALHILIQGYLSSLGNRKILTRSFVDSFSGYIPLFRSIIFLLGQKAPESSADVLAALQDAAGMNTGAFQMVLNIKTKSIKPTGDKLNSIFKEYYKAVEQLGDITDDIQV